LLQVKIDFKQETQLSLTNLATRLAASQGHQTCIPFHMLGMVSYYCPIVTFSVRRTVIEIFEFKNAVTLKTG